MKTYKILLGATAYDEIAFGEFGRYDDGRFSCMFETVRPFTADEKDKEELAEDFIRCFDKAVLYDMCNDYDCSPADLASELAEAMNIDEFIDCSLYSNEMIVDGNTWMFESGSCGQHDLREDGMETYTSKELFDLLMAAWDEYHLKTIPSDEFEKIVEEYNKVTETLNEEEWIKGYIENTPL